jgi:hypothetical protein
VAALWPSFVSAFKYSFGAAQRRTLTATLRGAVGAAFYSAQCAAIDSAVISAVFNAHW